ncbi:MAG: lysylphosphatidylglycerol synthase domain-containing protein, partial [Flavobacteriales bacterium]
WLSLDFATRSMVNNRMIHMLTGTLYSSIGGFLTLYLLSLDQELINYQVDANLYNKAFYPLLATSIIFLLITITGCFVSISKVPSKFSGFVLKKLKFLEEVENKKLPKKQFAIGFLAKMFARCVAMLEAAVIFYLLDITPTFTGVLTVTAMLSLSASIFFVVPQGIGVNEGGVSFAFSLLGLSPAIGLSIGLIRRARIIFFALVGVGLTLINIVYYKFIKIV